MEYKIVEHHNVANLVYQVQQLITEGWRPAGGVAVAREHGSTSYVQAMTRENLS